MPLHYSTPATTSIEKKTSRISGKASIAAVIKLIRVKQWVKNLFVFIPSFFAGSLFDFGQLQQLAIGALAFSFVASSIYIVNDYQDRHLDRLHPKKRFRPIASGEINGVAAWILVIIFSLSGLAIAGALSMSFFYLLIIYFALNLGYSFGLKNIPIVDLFIVSAGFLLRVYGGGILSGIHVTHWLSLMILLLSLFIIIAKRRDDMIITKKTGEVVRKSSQAYNLQFVNSCLSIISAVTVVAYIMYTVSPEVTERFQSDYLFITTIFVIAGIMRYLQITFVEKKSGSPTTILFKDKFILFTIISWIVSFYIIIYTT
ncbi:decaprenyl-phosphate phosphoribosyltransferase [Chryseosolibacter indicus]|uniref:Decaprenyl-phosphate phosphoribosyltransferase n=1 Tax=Chryseosolibacter indicus TaxID=2782351 RepID=A0ABS5VUF2_9BACT|nr:decaprenyl-phosphate phosphoribosyltransferase [Chryseosolibacter indicus]MBT1704465.1 decaprenyl-phosphate phosphoribosyltransferase [Chryseosolibacter indicus]